VQTPEPPSGEIACNCLALRQAARRITQFYDGALAPSGLRATQYSVLSMIAQLPDVLMKDLARALVMDRATLGHNLRPLQDQGLVTLGVGRDRREKPVRLTEAGRSRLGDASLLWQAAQRGFETAFGAGRSAALRSTLAAVSALQPSAADP
jgi:DNA-binding MarR family transcriptional regulator